MACLGIEEQCLGAEGNTLAITRGRLRHRRLAMTPQELRSRIRKLRELAPITAEFERVLTKRRNQRQTPLLVIMQSGIREIEGQCRDSLSLILDSPRTLG